MHDASPKRSRPTQLVVDLKTSKAPWQSWCKTHGLTPSEGVRRLIGRAINDDPAGSLMPVLPHVDGKPEKLDSRRLEIRLNREEHSAVTALAVREGMSVPRWLMGLVRLHLTGEQQFGQAELQALSRSTQVLLALGRSLNQVAREAAYRSDGNGITADQINYLSDLIKQHTRIVADVLNANSRRWRR